MFILAFLCCTESTDSNDMQDTENDAEPAADTEETPGPEKKFIGSAKYVNSGNGLNLRTGPSLHDDILLTLPYGAEVQVTEKGLSENIQGADGTWVKITYKRPGDPKPISGWVFDAWLRFSMPGGSYAWILEYNWIEFHWDQITDYWMVTVWGFNQFGRTQLNEISGNGDLSDLDTGTGGYVMPPLSTIEFPYSRSRNYTLEENILTIDDPGSDRNQVYVINKEQTNDLVLWLELPDMDPAYLGDTSGIRIFERTAEPVRWHQEE